MGRPRLLDLFCGAGGCSVGYARAGFDALAGLDQLASAKDLTREQASTVIEALDAAIRAIPAVTDSDEEGAP